MTMTYIEIINYLKQIENIGSIYGLERITALLKVLNHPEKDLKIIHTAGTNGKGSTNAFINQGLIENNYTTFAYISPALNEYLEKFLHNGQTIKKSTFETAMNEVIVASKLIETGPLGHPTIFEMEMAGAYLMAKIEKVDFFIQETGLGGRLDATNTIKNPLLSIITSISKDHLGILGETLEEIAFEKAGIIKESTPLILYDNGNLNSIFIKEAIKKNAPYTIVDFSNISYKMIREKVAFTLNHDTYVLGLNGFHQAKNAYVALLALFYLEKLGYNITREKIKLAFKKTYWAGRFEKILASPPIYLDGAHNEDSIEVLIKNLKLYHPKANHIFVLHIFNDKAIEDMLQKLDLADEIICTSINLSRSLTSKALADKAIKALPKSKIYEEADFNQALDKALYLAKRKKEPVISIFGSLSHLEKARQYLLGENK